MSRTTKSVLMGIIFGSLAIVFAILYHFNLIKEMDLLLAGTYIAYFVGLALLYNGAYLREYDKTASTVINFIFGFICISLSIALLVYGLVNGTIVLF